VRHVPVAQDDVERLLPELLESVDSVFRFNDVLDAELVGDNVSNQRIVPESSTRRTFIEITFEIGT
jgi:hypothetical protein